MVDENKIKQVHIRISHTYKTIRHFELWNIDNEELNFWQPFLKLETTYRNIITADDDSDAVDTREFIQKFCAKLEKEIYKFKKKRIVITTEINYSSLDLNLLFAPLPNLIETFDNNFEYFEAFLSQYVPIAFAESVVNLSFADIQYAANRTSSFGIFTNLNYEFQFSHSLHSAFLTAPTATPQIANTINWTTANKAKWAWIAANTSLVIPSLLAAVYLWWASEDQKDRYNALNSTTHSLLQQQSELIDSCYKILTTNDKKHASVSSAKASGSLKKAPQP